MKSFKNLLILIFSILFLSGCTLIEISTYKYNSDLTSESIDTIYVQNTVGSTTINEWDRNYISITAIKKGYFEGDADLIEINVEEGELFTIETIYPDYTVNVQVDYEIKIPVSLNVKVKSTTGSVSIDGGRCVESVISDTGSVSIRNSDYLKNISLTTGAIKADINGLLSDCQITTDTGDIVINVETENYSMLSAIAKVGNVAISIPTENIGDYKITVRTNTGSISIN